MLMIGYQKYNFKGKAVFFNGHANSSVLENPATIDQLPTCY
jgi:hypothetical protein